jgi:hypothetical protein
MPARKPRPPDEKSPRERFEETARELGCDEDEQSFMEKLAAIARYKPKANVSPTPKPPSKARS